MLNKLTNNRYYFFGFFLLIWILVQWLSGNLALSFNENCKTEDAFSYVESAKWLLNGGYPWFRAVGYPLLLAPFIYLFGENGTIVIFTIIQLACWLLTVRLIYSMLKIWNISAKMAFLASFIFALTVSNILTTNHLLTETIYSFLLLLSIYLTANWLKNDKYKYTGYIFIVLVVSALIRPLGLNFYYASVIILILGLIKGNFKLIPYFAISALLLIVHIGLMKKHHHTTQICMSKNHALYHYLYMKVSHYPNLNASSYEPQFFKESADFDSTIIDKPYFLAYRDSIYQIRNKTMFSTHKYATLKTMYVNFKDEILTGYSNHHLAKNWVYQLSTVEHVAIIFLYPLLCLLFLVVLLLKRIRDRRLIIWLILCLGVIGYICLGSSVVFWYGDRLHLPFYSLIIMVSFIIFNAITKSPKTV